MITGDKGTLFCKNNAVYNNTVGASMKQMEHL